MLKGNGSWKITGELLVFLFIFSFASLAFYHCYFKKRFSESFCYIRELNLNQALPDSEIVFLGDSHTCSAVDTSLIPRSLNYSAPSERYVHTYYKLKHLLELKPNIKTVVLQYDWNNVVRGHSEWDQLYFWKDLIDSSELDKEANTILYYQFVYKIMGVIAPYTSNLFRFFENDKNRTRSFPEKLNVAKEGYDHLTESKLERTVFWHFRDNTKKAKINELNKKYLFKILTLLNERQIDIYLIKFPLTNFYYKASEPLMDIVAYEDILSSLMKRYQNIKLIDYSYLFANEFCTGFNCMYFYDFDHLNVDGARKVSGLLAKELSVIDS